MCSVLFFAYKRKVVIIITEIPIKPFAPKEFKVDLWVDVKSVKYSLSSFGVSQKAALQNS